jgi:uncharacterized protein (DUF488 family)
MTGTIYTIGHSNHRIDRLIELLKSASVTAVSDVRTQPYSRMNPQFNREPLKKALIAEDIRYVFLGKELGARPSDRSCYRNGRVEYDQLAETALFKRGIGRLKEGALSFRVALLCAEKEPLDCHRTILIARRLVEQGIAVKHILADGGVEDHRRTVERLVDILRVPGTDLFRSSADVVAEAYERQGCQIADREAAPVPDGALASPRAPK